MNTDERLALLKAGTQNEEFPGLDQERINELTTQLAERDAEIKRVLHSTRIPEYEQRLCEKDAQIAHLETDLIFTQAVELTTLRARVEELEEGAALALELGKRIGFGASVPRELRFKLQKYVADQGENPT